MTIRNEIKKHFQFSESQLRIALFLFENGISIRDGVPYINRLKISISGLAESVKADRRVVLKTIEAIGKEPELRAIFQLNRLAGPSLEMIGRYYDKGVIEIGVAPQEIGVLAGVTSEIAKRKLTILQLFAQSSEVAPDPRLIIIIEGEIPGDLISQLRVIRGVKSITVYGPIYRSEIW